MKGKPLIPFAVIAVVGILLMLSLSLQGFVTSQAGDAEGEEEIVEFDDPIAAGEELVQQTCIGCHGNDLQGVGNNPAINALSGKYSEEEIAEIVQKGIGSMPPTGKNEVEAAAIATYLLSISE